MTLINFTKTIKYLTILPVAVAFLFLTMVSEAFISPTDFTQATDFDSVNPIPLGTYPDNCQGPEGFILPLCGIFKSIVTYEGVVTVQDDDTGRGGGHVLRLYPFQTPPTHQEHHALLLTNYKQNICPTECWFGSLYYFPKPFLGGNGRERMMIHGSQGTATAGPYIYLSKPKNGYNRILFKSQSLPILPGKWFSLRVHIKTGINQTVEVFVTDLDGNPVVAGQKTSISAVIASVPTNINRVKWGSDNESDIVRDLSWYWYEDNAYIVQGSNDPGVWK